MKQGDRMGLNIRTHRKAMKLTQEELGALLAPKVNRAAVNKWETGQVRNIKRSHIAQMSTLFGCSPTELMAFEEDIIVNSENRNTLVQNTDRMIRLMSVLNKAGQEMALKQVEVISHMEEYKGEYNG